ncbi:alpha/beta hydrolase [Halogeometricum sp. S1BR25-6]|uniref:Alpha/beta hydrolase n=1 Tax=Halogeometricum salsisoli TaxID=2950536 RepID=A0ABU2GGN0_9EURY|nr:alpha/beta hydrolase [Halogeometricum sp. S1BR25-6]MDS0299464.1 alpha/beta hydrolase [Halogeometricum sp. S1BR25-6]
MERRAPEVDPQVRDAVERFEREGLPPWHALSVESARTVEDEAFAATDPPAVERVGEFSIAGPRGPVPLRTYHPAPEETRGVLVFYHGGGWTLGTLDSAAGICRRLADRSGRLVVSVDYRLAPEHPFPEPLDDAVAAYEWVRGHAGSLGGDPESVVVGGTSAGGNLAAAVSLRAAAESEGVREVPTPAGQLLLYPILAQTFDTDSYEENADGPLLSRADMAWFRGHYLRSDVDRYNPFAAPVRADEERLAETPPACVVTGGFDPLRDEGTRYAARLREAGVAVVHQHYPAMAHGFLSLAADVDAADEAFDRVAERLAEFDSSVRN